MDLSRIRLRVVAPVALVAFAVVGLALWWLDQFELLVLGGLVVVVALQLLVLVLVRRTGRNADSRPVLRALRGGGGSSSPPEYAEQLLVLHQAADAARLAREREVLGQALRRQREIVEQGLADHRALVDPDAGGAAGGASTGAPARGSGADDAMASSRRSDDAVVRRYEAVLAVYEAFVADGTRLPDGAWVARPDLVHAITRLVDERRPSVVLELGSGQGTVVLAALLAHVGEGRLVSLVDDPDELARIRDLVTARGLDHVVDLRHAPIRQLRAGETTVSGHDPAALPDGPVDLLVVGHPSGPRVPGWRHPVLALVADRLADDVAIVLDDDRDDDGDDGDARGVVDRWLAEHPGLARAVEPGRPGPIVLVTGPTLGATPSTNPGATPVPGDA